MKLGKNILNVMEISLSMFVFLILAFYFIPNIIVVPVFLSVLYIIMAIKNRKLICNRQAIFLSVFYIIYYAVEVIGNISSREFMTGFILYSTIFVLCILVIIKK